MNFYNKDNMHDANVMNWNQYEQPNDLCGAIPLDMDTFVIPSMEELESVNQNVFATTLNTAAAASAAASEFVQAANQDFSINGVLLVQQPFDLLNNQGFMLANNYANIQNYRTYVYANDLSQLAASQQNDNVSKVDILNQAISSVTSRPGDYKLTNNLTDMSDDTFTTDPRRKFNKSKTTSRIKCNVCGNASSGFHYGAHTCEACKLFFRRAEKQIRKTGFPECPKKNCSITSESRASCANCRYKKCIAAGMSMTRSRYGRRTETFTSSYTPNISDILCYELNQIKTRVLTNVTNITIDDLNDLIIDFYLKAFNVLNNPESSTNSNSSSSDMDQTSDYSYTSNSPLSEFSYMSSSGKCVLPNSTIVLFCVLFDLKSKLFNAIHFKEIFEDYELFFQFLKTSVLVDHEFVPMLKIGIYIKVLRVLFEKIPPKDHPVDKRISDLMRSEFACSKNNANDSTSYVLLLSQLNHLLFKHMTKYEIQTFLSLPKEMN